MDCRKAQSVYLQHGGFCVLLVSSVPLALPQIRSTIRATDRNSKHPYIGLRHLLTSLPISSVSPFVYNSSCTHCHLPSLHSALLLLAARVVVLGVSSLLPIKSWHRLPVFVHTPAKAPLSAFRRTALQGKAQGERRLAAIYANLDEYAALWVTSHFTQWSRTAIVKRH